MISKHKQRHVSSHLRHVCKVFAPYWRNGNWSKAICYKKLSKTIFVSVLIKGLI
ncbi:hypothetical protein Hanom_Chr16g01499381 [Helianthus anomalus]